VSLSSGASLETQTDFDVIHRNTYGGLPWFFNYELAFFILFPYIYIYIY
jgi:hypothetical protein